MAERLTEYDSHGDLYVKNHDYILASYKLARDACQHLINAIKGEENELLFTRVLTNSEAEKWDKWLSLEEHGRLIELPCAVGDIVYLFSYDNIHPFIINGFEINKYEFEFKGSYCGEEKNLEHWEIRLPVSKICKTVFLTPEEAEAKLKERGEQE